MQNKKMWWVPLVNFTVHVAVGTGLFLIIGLPAVGLSLLVDYLARLGISPFVVRALTMLEYFFFLVDLASVATYAVWTSFKQMKDLLNE